MRSSASCRGGNRSIRRAWLPCSVAALTGIAGVALAQAVPSGTPTDAARGVLSYADLLAPALPAVVYIEVQQKSSVDIMSALGRLLQESERDRDPKGRFNKRQTGAGFIVDAANGLVVTTNYMMDDADKIRVTLADGRVFDGTAVGTDDESQIGLIRIKAERLTAAAWGDARRVRVGDLAFAVGHPYNLGQTVTSGIIAGFPTDNPLTEYRSLILSDVPISRGSGGGPLLDSRGRVVGVTVGMFARSNDIQLTLAVPADMAQRAVQELAAHGSVRHHTIGIRFASNYLDNEVGDDEPPSGVRITEVAPDSSAGQAGLKVGDVIVAVDGQRVNSAGLLHKIIRTASVGAQLEITYNRGSLDNKARVTVTESG